MRTRASRRSVLALGAVFCASAVACGGGDAGRGTVERDPGSSIAGEEAAETRSGSRPVAHDTALLDLVPDARRSGRGHFRLTAPEDIEGVHLAANVDGVFWTHAGRIRTAVRLDRSLVGRAVATVLARLASGGLDPAARAAFLLDEDYYQGSAYQFGLGHLVAMSGLLGTGSAAAVPGEPPSCAASRSAAASAVVDEVARLEPDFGPEGSTQRWTVPLESLARRTEAERAAARQACALTDDAPSLRSGLRLERTSDTIDVLMDSGLYTTPQWRHVLRFEVRADAEARVPAGGENPADGFDPVSTFVMKIHECGASPVEYSNFAAGDSYRAPDEDDYLGPGIFVTDYVCAVPE